MVWIEGVKRNLQNRKVCLVCCPFKSKRLSYGETKGKRKWTDQRLTDAVRESTCFSDVARNLGLSVNPGNFRTLRKYIDRLGLDVGHFRVSANSVKVSGELRLKSEDILKENSHTNPRKLVLREKLISYLCSICGNPGEHFGSPLVLQLDHINGNPTDNRLENLRFLCPNCHSQTPTFCNRTRK